MKRVLSAFLFMILIGTIVELRPALGGTPLEFCLYDRNAPYGEGASVTVDLDEITDDIQGFTEDFGGAYSGTHLRYSWIHNWTRIRLRNGSYLNIGIPVWDIQRVLSQTR